MDANTEAADAPAAAQSPTFLIEAAFAARINLADYQNAVPVLRELSVTNHTEAAMPALILLLESVPPVLAPRTWRLDALGAKQQYRLTDLDVALDGAALARLTEAEPARAALVLRRADAVDGEVLARWEQPIELLPRHHWAGLSATPDMVAAFVQPNEPAIDRVLKQVADVLRTHGKAPALNGYAGGTKRAWELASALWTAIAAWGVDYALPPASFEVAGQKIRSAAHIADGGVATCMDLALLFCSALEQLGLHPLLVFTKGHAFAGVWLKPAEFSTVVIDDITALRKRLALKELLLFETTLVTQRPAPAFGYAVERGAQQVAEDQEGQFQLAVDIRRARLQKIKPLASPEAAVPDAAAAEATVEQVAFDEAPDLPDFAQENDDTDPALLTPAGRLARWQRKLLDLSLRNNLLNFKGGRKPVSLVAPDGGALEDVLASGETVKLLAKPALMEGGDRRNLALYEAREREDVHRSHALNALRRGEVFVDLPPREMDARLLELYRNTRSALQESGANTLFLALGFLSWTNGDRPDDRYRAPLVLVPVSLERRSARAGFSLTLHDDEPRFNPTLLEMLRQDFGLHLSVGEGELPRDASGLDLAAIWRSVSRSIKDYRGWEVSEEIVLATFSFAKYLMWKDLAERTEQLRESPVVRHLIDTPREPFQSAGGGTFTPVRELDQTFTPAQTFCPLPADSSQLSAVMAAARGKDFVLIGPPGTGKSQTIANLIAQCLGEGKRVLFVSEKVAALDVVYRRLRDVGLGDFCLELHSSKARKLDVLAQLQDAWDNVGTVDRANWQAEAERLRRVRDQLNDYVQHLHQVHRNGLTVYQAIGKITAGADQPVISLAWDQPDAHDRADLDALRDAVDLLAVQARALGATLQQADALGAVHHTEWSPRWQQQLVDAASTAATAAQTASQAAERLRQQIGFPALPLTRRVRATLAVLARILPQVGGRNWRFVLRPDATSIGTRLQEGLGHLAQHQELSRSLSAPWPAAVLSRCEQGLQWLAQHAELHASLTQPWPAALTTDLERGLTALAQVAELQGQLSTPYGPALVDLNAALLQSEWHKAENTAWPAGWWAKRKILAFLKTVTANGTEPNAAHDIPLLVRIRRLQADVAAMPLAPVTEGVWAGAQTSPELVRCALRFQSALLAAGHGEAWVDEGFGPIEKGQGGARFASTLATMRQLRELERQLAGLQALAADTGGLWAGMATAVEPLRAALGFQRTLQAVQAQGALAEQHPQVAAGQCGNTMARDLQLLRQRQSVEAALLACDDLRDTTAGLWAGLATRAEEVDRAVKFQKSIAAALAHLTHDAPETLPEVQQALSTLLGNAHAKLGTTGPVAAASNAYLEAWSHLQPAFDQLGILAHWSDAEKASHGDLVLDELAERGRAIAQAQRQLNAWCAWQRARQAAVSFGLQPVVTALEKGEVEPTRLREVFETNYCRWWMNATVDADEVIRSFVAAQHEKRIADFRALDDRFVAMTRSLVRAQLCADLPRPETVTQQSEWGMLKRELHKKSQHLPVRELIARIPTALTRLTPCLLMSPLSIAQYLSPEVKAFDLVVFDEASQITVWDAIGAIARGKQVVMVGDPKQLPPTNFFGRADGAVDGDGDDAEADMESILDECMGANLPTLNLAWHYRSRYESLIAFSNHRYYGDGLVTFPSPVTDDRAVSFHAVRGTYAKGSTRTNVSEAKALVADLVAKLKAPGFTASGLTIGVVTFNGEQQRLIEDLLEAERRNDPSIEPHFSDKALEPVFVKNLESVQGDERDIIYFSITFGPDQTGLVSMNFGPMNRSGGERRLNVAITRAREELRVFSSLHAEQMDLSRTQARGVRDLKHFLSFAERGQRAIAEAVRSEDQRDFDSPFEAAVADALERKGWRLHRQVGASRFRVDLAVLHPEAPGAYLSGVECDGATYHRSATARDRDKLREQVLRGLGWEIVRVWSTDWWIDPVGTLERVDAQLHALMAESRVRRAREAEDAAARAAEAEAQTAITLAQQEAEQAAVATDEAVDTDDLGDAEGSNAEADPTVDLDAELYAHDMSAPTTRSTPAAQFVDYIEADPLDAIDTEPDPEAFFSGAYNDTLDQMLEHVVRIEGPVLDSVLARRIARAHGWQRTGVKIMERVTSRAAALCPSSYEAGIGTFFWSPDGLVGEVAAFRRAGRGVTREMEEVCSAELKRLAAAFGVGQKLIDPEGGLAKMAAALGVSRLGTTRRQRLELAWGQVFEK